MLTASRHDTFQDGFTRGVHRKPVSFDGCLGWLHTPAIEAMADVAVVLCSGLRTDGITGYRSFRILGDALAGARYPTLRFDYPGTGDSRDLGAAEPWAAWQQSIHTAADWLREQTGARRIVLCGLRIGATLAAMVAAQRDDVAGLALFEPILRGRSFIRELITEETMRSAAPQADEALVTGELVLPPETVRSINQLRLHDVVPPRDCRIVVFARTPTRVLTECLDAWAARGVDVTREDFAGLEPMLRPGFMCHEPSVKVARIVAWLRASVPTSAGTPLAARAPANVEIRHTSCVETPLRFGADCNLYGVLCRPLGQPEADRVVIIVNQSGDPHHGGSRLNVELARALAVQGFTSLRMDFAGLGDSVAPGDVETHVYETDRRADVAAAIDALEELGYRRFVVQGLCSGGYHAFHVALSEPRISEIVVVNLPLFQWRFGESVELISYIQMNPVSRFRKFRQKDFLARLARQGLPGLRARLAMQGAWVAETAKIAGWCLMELCGMPLPPTFAQDSLRRLSQRTRTLFLFTEGDAGLPGLQRELGDKPLPSGTELRVIPGPNHILIGPEVRSSVVDHMVEFIRRDAAPLDAAPAWETTFQNAAENGRLSPGHA